MSDAGTPPKDYKDSLNLPRTEFPIKGNLAKLEPRMPSMPVSVSVPAAPVAVPAWRSTVTPPPALS